MSARAGCLAVLTVLAATTRLAGTRPVAASTGLVATPPVAFVVTGNGTGTATAVLHNTSAGPFQIELVRDPACDTDLDFSLSGANPFTLPGAATKQITFACTNARLGLERCTVHAIDASSHEPLADLAGVCEHVTSTNLASAPATLAFGPVGVGQAAALPLVVTNHGTAPVTKLAFQTDELDDNFEIALPCNPDAPACDGTIAPLAAGGSTPVIVHCTPRTSGAHTAHLEIATDGGLHLGAPITLTCTGVDATTPVLGVSPPGVSIATPVDVVSSVVRTTIYLENLGTGTVQITDIRPVDIDQGAAFDWTFTLGGTCTSVSCMLGPGQRVSVDLAFDPSQAALRRALLLVLFRDTLDRTRAIPLTGTGLGATLQLAGTPTTLDLGATPIGKPTSATLHFGNTGNRPTMPILGLAPPGPFSLAPPATLTVAPTTLADLLATCTPSVAGPVATTISATSTDTISTTTLQIATTCTGLATALYAMPTSLDLGEVRLDGGPLVRTFDALSAGATLALAGPPHLDTANPNLQVGAPSATTTPTSFVLTVTPQTEGDLRSKIVVDDLAGDRIEIPIRGQIVTAAYGTPASADLGTFCVDQPTTPSNLTLSSTGTATLGVTAPALSAGAPFALDLVAPTGYPARLTPGKAAIASVTPLRQAAKTKLTGTLTWTTDDASAPTATTMLAASFIDSGGAIAPTTLQFVQVPVHLYLANGQRVTIQNCSNSALELEPPTVPVPFSIDSPSFPTQLAPGETATFTVGFHPTRVVDVEADLKIRSPQLPGAPLVVHLSGTVATDPAPGMDGGAGPGALPSGSFYACSCTTSSPGGAVPLLLALAAIFRRRGGSS